MNRARDILSALEARRKALGISRRVVAERAGLGLATVERALLGHAGVGLPAVVAIAQALGADLGIIRAPSPAVTKRRQAAEKARKLVALAQGTAALESQAVDLNTVNREERHLTARLLSGPALRLWA